jgi:cytochrome P450
LPGLQARAMTVELIDFDPLSAAYLRDPAPALKRLQAEQPIFYYPPLDCWVFTRYHDLRAALADVVTFSSRATGFIRPPPDLEPLVPDLSIEDVIITLDPPVHNDGAGLPVIGGHADGRGNTSLCQPVDRRFRG